MTFEEWSDFTGQPFLTILERERCKTFFQAGVEQERERNDSENTQLREALVKIYRRADILADEPIVEICEAVFFTPTAELEEG